MKRRYPNETSAACKSQIPEIKLQKNTKLQISVKNLWQSRRQEIVNGSKPYNPAGIGRTTTRGHSRCAMRWSLSPTLPLGEGELFSPRRTFQSCWLSTARGALFPLPEGEDQGEGKRRELQSRVSDLSPARRTGQVPRRSRRFS